MLPAPCRSGRRCSGTNQSPSTTPATVSRSSCLLEAWERVSPFIDPRLRFPLLTIAWFLLKKKLGFKALMKVVSQDASLVKGSHGRIPEDPLDWPVLIAPASAALPPQVASTDVYARIAQGF